MITETSIKKHKKKYTLLVLPFFLFFQLAYGQSSQLNEEMWEQVFQSPDSAIILGQNIIANVKSYEKSNSLAKTYAQMGVAYDLKGMPDTALSFFHKAIKIQESNKDSVGLSFSYNNLGLMYYAQYDYPEALKHLRKSQEIDMQIGDFEHVAGSMVNIGIILTYLDSLEESVNYYNQAISLYEKANNEKGKVVVLSNLGKVYFGQKEYNKALETYHKVEVFYNQNNATPEEFSGCYNSLSNTYFELKKYDKAIEYALKDLEVCNKAQLTNKKQFVYEILNRIYFAKGDYKTAYGYVQKYAALRDSILNDNRTAVIKEMQVKYETEKTKGELAKTQLEKEKNEIEHQKERVFYFGGIAVLLLVLVMLFFRFKSKQKINKLLEEKNNLNEAIIEQKEMMMAEVHHRVKNNLQLISNIIDLQVRNSQNNEVSESLNDIHKRIFTISELHHFLYKGEDVQKIDIHHYLTGLMDGLKQTFNKEVNTNINVEAMKLSADTSVPIGLIVNELVTNAFKHAFKGVDNPILSIKLKKQNNTLYLSIADNGLGIQENNEEEKTSFGMKMIRSLCRQLKATWNTSSNNGTEHTFLIERFKIYE